MDTQNDPQRGGWDRPPDHGQDEPDEERYLGLTPTQFNVTVLGIIGVVAAAVGLFFFGGAGAVGDFFSGDDESSSESVAVVKTVTPAATEAAPEPTPEATPAPAPTVDVDDTPDGGGGAAVEQVLNTFDPFSLMGALGSPASAPDIDITGPGGAPSVPSEQADGSLKAVLLQEGDLPPGLVAFGDMSFSIPTETGTADMAANMFASGDLAGGDLGTMVMSMALGGSDMAGEFDDFDDFDEMTQADLDEVAGYLDESGIVLTDMRLLDASGLGDAGMGMHMAMDFSGMFDALGLPPDEPMPAGIAWDMYVFVRGERVLMVMVMWPSDGVSGVDARTLADIMDARAVVQ
jgi:hypothetical protein